MENIKSAEEILFNCFQELSTELGEHQLEVISSITVKVLCAIHRHSAQFLLPLLPILKGVELVGSRQVEHAEITRIAEEIDRYLHLSRNHR